jgi:hypothetical protein
LCTARAEGLGSVSIVASLCLDVTYGHFMRIYRKISEP